MSHSFKHTLIVKDGTGSTYKPRAKRWANKTVRRSMDVPNGKAYRKIFNPWDICEHTYRFDPTTDSLTYKLFKK